MLSNRIWISKSDKWKNRSEVDYFSNRELEVLELQDGIVLPAKYCGKPAGSYLGGVCNSKFEYIAGVERESKKSKGFPGYYGMANSYTVEDSELQKDEESVIFGGALIGHFGHFMLESISARLWYVISNPDDLRKIVFVSIKEEKKWFYDFMELCGIDSKRIIMINKPTKFSHITIPEESVHSWFNYTKEYLWTYNEITKNVNNKCNKQAYEKVYLSHKRWQAGCECINENIYEDFFENQGYKVIEPEELPLEEQIFIVNNAKEIATTIGSLSHFALFCKPKTKFVMLTREPDSTIWAQCLVNQASKVDWYIVNANNNYLYANRRYGPVNFSFTDEFMEFSKEFFGNASFEAKSDELEYIKSWTKYYANPQNFNKICNLSAYDFINRFSKELLGNDLDKSKYNLELNDKYNSLQKEANKEKSILENLDDFLCKSILNKSGILVDKLFSLLLCDVHVSNIGWVKDYDCSTIYRQKQIEAIRIKLFDSTIRYSYTVFEKQFGWTREVTNGECAGTTGKALPIQSILIKIEDCGYRVIYKVHDGNKWSKWYMDGEETEIVSHIEGISICIIKKELYDYFN